MLPNCRRVWAVWLQDLIPPVNVVLLYQLFFVLVEVLCVGDPLFEGLIGETGEEVLLQVGRWSRRGPIVLVFEL